MKKSDRIAGMLWGSLGADALALGAHWEYDQGKLREKFGRVDRYLVPRPDSYHAGKSAGEQTHLGDQTLVLLDSLRESGGFSLADFTNRWGAMWSGYSGFVDHATKETLGRLGTGAGRSEEGSKELGGAARIAPLVAAMADGEVDDVVLAARAQTGLTHGSPLAGDVAEFLTRVVIRVVDGEEPRAAIEVARGGDFATLDLAAMLARVSEVNSMDVGPAAESLGLGCPIPSALPVTLMLLDRYADDFELALVENVMVGGDSAARGLVLGMILGAHHGVGAIRNDWMDGLVARRRVWDFLG
jgi:ADP-ribosylglycohydrolase